MRRHDISSGFDKEEEIRNKLIEIGKEFYSKFKEMKEKKIKGET